MAIDNLALEIISADLFKEMKGAFFDKPFALGENQFALPYHGGRKEHNSGRGTFIVSLDPSNPFISYSYNKFTKVNLNTPFFNSLRKLAGSQIVNVSKLVGERIVFLETKNNVNQLETLEEGYQLIIELFPQRPNAYLINEPGDRISSLYKENGDVFQERYMARNLPYLPPPKRETLSLKAASLEEAEKFLSRSTGRLFKAYAEKVSFPIALKELLSSKSLFLINGNVEPFSFQMAEAKPLTTERIYNSYITDQKKLAHNLSEASLIMDLKKAVEIAEKKKSHLEEDLQAAKNKLSYMDFGQELLLHQTEYEKGMESMDVDGYHIPLDKKLDAVNNAKAYFHKYHKAKAALEVLSPLILKTQDEISYLKGKLLEAEKGNGEDILELKEELYEEGYLKAKEKRQRPSFKEGKASPHYLVGPDYKIGFGMNAYQNEALTFKIAKPDDLFLHVKDYPGAHVVILSREDDQTALLAAELALFLSDLNQGEVISAPVRKVKKNKTKRGLVNVLEYESLIIRKIRESSLALFKENLKLD
ncbi:MAG: NFACT family protein [Bacilli bacterium]|jgi:predicted ribosome quality control (RQC) complex YloA/Tae2 family protein|nr:NFACT family protein [Bacilli bacterium]